MQYLDFKRGRDWYICIWEREKENKDRGEERSYLKSKDDLVQRKTKMSLNIYLKRKKKGRESKNKNPHPDENHKFDLFWLDLEPIFVGYKFQQ